MKIVKEITKFKTKSQYQILDLTEKAERFLEKAKIKDGILLVWAFHTSATLAINEAESCFFKDFQKFAKKFFPRGKKHYYEHNDLNVRTENLVCGPGVKECLNGDSHIAHMFVGSPSVTVPVEDGKLVLGQWQRIFFLELDDGRQREVLFKAMGV